MNSENIVALVIMVPIVALFVILGAVLQSGKGAWMIAGYNTSSKAEKARYDEKALCRFVAKLMYFCAFCLVLFALAPFVGMWLLWASFALMLIVIFAAVIYANTGNRFKKR